MKPFFAGRETDIRRLLAFAEEAFAGKAGIAFVTGEAGIGKTALAEELIRRLQSGNTDMVVATGKCTVNEASYLPFRAILENLVGSEKRFVENSEKAKKFMEVVFDTIWTAGPDLMGIFGIPIKALQAAVEKHGLRTKKQTREMTIPKDLDPNQIYGWYTKIIQEISAKFPLTLFLDDLHWADDSSLNLLFHLGRELGDRKILVVATYRPHDVGPDSRLPEMKTRLERYGAREFSLDVSEEQPEDADKIRQFVRAYLTGKYGTNFSEHFESLLADRTQGNALFLTEILKNMEEKGQIVCERESAESTRWKLAKEIGDIDDFPKQIEVVIRERIDRLEKGLREILTYASVEGDDFLAQVVAKAKQIGDWELIDELTEKLMTMFQLIWERGGKSLPNGNRVHEFSFRHNLIREYVYDRIPKAKKEHLHAQIGECLEHLYAPNPDEIAGTLAVHFCLGYVPAKAVSYSLKAAKDANSRYGTAEAVRYAKMGIEALEECRKTMSDQAYAVNKIKLVIELAKAEEYGGNLKEKKDHIQGGISILEENLKLLQHVQEKLQAEFFFQLGKLHKRKGNNYQAAKDVLEKAIFLYDKHGNNKQIAETYSVLADVYLYIPSSECNSNPYNQSIAALERSLNISMELRDVGLESKILSLLSWKHRTVNFNYAERCAIRALELSRSASFIYAETKALKAMAVIHRKYARYKSSIQCELESLELAKKTGDIFSQATGFNDLGFDYCRYFDLIAKGQHSLEKSIAIKTRIGSKNAASLSNMAWIFARQGEWKQAEQYWEKAITESSEREQSFYQYYIGRLYAIQDRYAEAETKFVHRINILKKYSSSSSEEFVFLMTAQNYAKFGNIIKSRSLLENANALFNNLTAPRDNAEYLYERAETYRVLQEYNSAKTDCEQSLLWLLNNAEEPEKIRFVAEARLVMGKILVDMKNYQESIDYLDKAKTAFAIGRHYALGETMLYLGKAHLGIGNKTQAKTLVTDALAEFQRLELSKKETEARQMLKMLGRGTT